MPRATARTLAPDRHAAKLAVLRAALRDYDGDAPLVLRKKAVSHVVPKRHDPFRVGVPLDVSAFDEILAIDPIARVCTAEPGVTFDALVKATLAHGLLPTVVPELRTITIGGAVAGCSLESTSFMRGGFHDGCLEYEVVTADGEVLCCTPDNEHGLVFQMMHGTFGTLGILTKLRFTLVPALPFVHVTHHMHARQDDYAAAIHRHFVDRDVDFMDGIIHAADRHGLSLGQFVHDAPYTHRYDWTRVYYESTARRDEDYLATIDYLFRYDHGVTNVHPKRAVGRLLFGKLLHSDRLLRTAEALHRFLPDEQPAVTLDTFIPFSRFGEFMQWHIRTLGHFPLWCVPYRPMRRYEWLDDRFWAQTKDELFIDLAIYGMRQPPGINVYQLIERELMEVGGMKTLISHNYYDEATFWRIWNRPNYLAVKAITDPRGVLGDLYQRTCGHG